MGRAVAVLAVAVGLGTLTFEVLGDLGSTGESIALAAIGAVIWVAAPLARVPVPGGHASRAQE